jgi:hypothetical protein
MSAELPEDQANAARDANRRQANYFHAELRRHIGLLNQQSDKFRQAMAEYEQCNDTYGVRRLQEEELRSTVVER